MSTLQVSGVSKHFGGVRAVSNVSFSVSAGEILACVGPNAAGKTTLLNLISGWQQPDEGRIYIDGQAVMRLSPETFSSRGVVRTFQKARLFQKQTVLENLILASRPHKEETLWAALFFRRLWARSRSQRVLRAEKILGELDLPYMRDKRASTLSGGERRLAELAAAAVRRPRILLLDEPVANLSQHAKDKVAAFLLRQREAGVACFIIEHDLSFVRQVADRVLILAQGEVFSVGRSDDELTWETVEKCYLSVSPLTPNDSSTPVVEPLRETESPRKSGANVLRLIRKTVRSARAVNVPAADRYEPLVVRDLCVDYGCSPVLRDINIEIRPGELVALIGGNGAGKSTMIRAILGLVQRRGVIKLGNKELTSLTPYDICSLGIAYVPQHKKVFPSLTVFENLLLALRSGKQSARNSLDTALLAFPDLKDWLHRPAGNLSGGQQQMVALACALLRRPRLLLLDEPSAGLTEYQWTRFVRILKLLVEDGLPILIVEHRPSTLNELIARGYLIKQGRITASGPWEEISSRRSLHEHLFLEAVS